MLAIFTARDLLLAELMDRVVRVAAGDQVDVANIRQLWAAHGDDAMWSSDLFGDFRVCPLTKDRPGRMQFVSVEEAANLHLRPRP